MEQIIIRHDDFDFRLEPGQYKTIHEAFIKHGLTETAVLQFTQDGNLKNFHTELIEYMRTSPNWNIQIHGWEHTKYDEMTYDAIVKDLLACKALTYKLFGVWPSIWFPPWNCYSEATQRAADFVGLTIDRESYDIKKFLREVQSGIYKGHSLYFHGWNRDEMEVFYPMLELVKAYENR